MGNLESMKKFPRNVQSPKTKHRKNRNMNKSITISEPKFKKKKYQQSSRKRQLHKGILPII